MDGAGETAGGLLTKRLAEDWLASVLDQAQHGTLPGMVRTGATVADDAEEWLRYVEHDRDRKPSMVPLSSSARGSGSRAGTSAGNS